MSIIINNDLIKIIKRNLISLKKRKYIKKWNYNFQFNLIHKYLNFIEINIWTENFMIFSLS